MIRRKVGNHFLQKGQWVNRSRGGIQLGILEELEEKKTIKKMVKVEEMGLQI